jgi:hypothetical protein
VLIVNGQQGRGQQLFGMNKVVQVSLGVMRTGVALTARY